MSIENARDPRVTLMRDKYFTMRPKPLERWVWQQGLPASAERIYWYHWDLGAQNGTWCSQVPLRMVARECCVDVACSNDSDRDVCCLVQANGHNARDVRGWDRPGGPQRARMSGSFVAEDRRLRVEAATRRGLGCRRSAGLAVRSQRPRATPAAWEPPR